MNGFVYFIGWTAQDRWYIGSRYAAGALPADMWDTYFTSSKPVKRFAMIHGKPDVIDIMFGGHDIADIRDKERKLIAASNAVNDPAFFNEAGALLKDVEVTHIKSCWNAGSPTAKAVDLAKLYGVSRTTIYNVWNGNTFASK